MFNFTSNCQKLPLFTKEVVPFCTFTMYDSFCYTFPPESDILHLLNGSRLVDVKWILTVVLICISPTTTNDE